MRTPRSDFVLPVDKPEGPTSHDIVQAARRALGTRRVGHTGTLDPFASGLLLLCVGRATRLAEYLTGLDKTYEAVAQLGRTTDTLDPEGDVVEERGGWERLDRAEIEEAMRGFVGAIDQLPPRFSAKKVAGVAAHRRVRRGEEVELPPCRVRIDAMELTEVDLPTVSFRVRCSSGTYVRSLARDLGEALGVGAHLTGLRRTEIGSLGVEQGLPPELLAASDAVGTHALEPLDALSHLPSIEVDAEAVARLAMGQALPAGAVGIDGPLVVASAGELVAVAEARGGAIRPRKVFVA